MRMIEQQATTTGSGAFPTPTIEQSVPGPRNELGLLLRAPPSDVLAWDLEAEIMSTRRSWLPERGAWWIAAPYLPTVIGIVLRSFPSVLLTGAEEDRLLSRDGIDALQGRLW